MLKAFKAQLTQLAEQQDKSLEKRFRKEAVYSKAKEHAGDLENFILSLPMLLEQTRLWLESDDTPRHLKKLYAYLLTYLYHSLDFLPEQDFGFWGYLDDAYIVGLGYQKTLEYHLDSAQALRYDFQSQIDGWLAQTREVIPQHTENLDRLFQNALSGNADAFHAAIAP